MEIKEGNTRPRELDVMGYFPPLFHSNKPLDPYCRHEALEKWKTLSFLIIALKFQLII